jgi:hypothetical protein
MNQEDGEYMVRLSTGRRERPTSCPVFRTFQGETLLSGHRIPEI